MYIPIVTDLFLLKNWHTLDFLSRRKFKVTGGFWPTTHSGKKHVDFRKHVESQDLHRTNILLQTKEVRRHDQELTYSQFFIKYEHFIIIRRVERKINSFHHILHVGQELNE